MNTKTFVILMWAIGVLGGCVAGESAPEIEQADAPQTDAPQAELNDAPASQTGHGGGATCAVLSRVADFTALDESSLSQPRPIGGVSVQYYGLRAPAVEVARGRGLRLVHADVNQTLELAWSDGPAVDVSIELSADTTDLVVQVDAYEYDDDPRRMALSLHGPGVHDISAQLGDLPIVRLRLRATGGEGALAQVRYTSPDHVRVAFEGREARYGQEFSLGGMDITGSSALREKSGMGVEGGRSDDSIDPGESVEFHFVSDAARFVYVERSLIGNLDGDATSGDSLVEAFDIDGASLGIVRTDSGDSTIAVSQLFDGVPISAFRLTSDGDYQVISGIRYARCTL